MMIPFSVVSPSFSRNINMNDDYKTTFRYAPLMRNINGNFLYKPVSIYTYGNGYYSWIGGAVPKDKPLFESIEECQKQCDEMNKDNTHV